MRVLDVEEFHVHAERGRLSDGTLAWTAVLDAEKMPGFTAMGETKRDAVHKIMEAAGRVWSSHGAWSENWDGIVVWAPGAEESKMFVCGDMAR